jgi:hypothetical protein
LLDRPPALPPASVDQITAEAARFGTVLSPE